MIGLIIMSLCEPTISFYNFYHYLIVSFSWVDRDMFMRYFGGGIGHQTQAERWTLGSQKDPQSNNMNIDVNDDEDHISNNLDAQLQELHQLAIETSIYPAESEDEDVNTSDSDDSENSSMEGHSLDSDSDENVDDHESYFGPEDGEGYEKDDDGFDDF